MAEGIFESHWLIVFTELHNDKPTFFQSDLGTLEDVESGGWAEEAEEDITTDAIRNKRRMEREKKLLEHYQKKQEKELQQNKRRDRVSALGKLS